MDSSLSRSPIRALPRDLAEKIAAGEVVERPSSAIKELVENSIDAGARSIRVELQNGGKTWILVEDDGHGIPDDELLLALQRHATSKIQNLDDLWNLSTLGFRGEALPSIAAVSRFTLESRFSSLPGKKLYLEGGNVLTDTAMAASPLQFPHGTRVIVEDLFYNVPARLKFQKSKTSESSQVRELLERIAFSHPQIQFTLLSDGRKLLDLKAVPTLEKRVSDIFDTKTEDLEFFEAHFEAMHLQGFIDRNSRVPNSRHVFLSANQRMVRDKLLHQAVIVGLRSMLMEGEYPKLYLSIQVPAADIDVNVHPAKSEVRFHRSKDVFQFVQGSLERLAQKSPKPFYSTETSSIAAVSSKLSAHEPRTAYSATTPNGADKSISQPSGAQTQSLQNFAPTEPLFQDKVAQFKSKPSFEGWRSPSSEKTVGGNNSSVKTSVDTSFQSSAGIDTPLSTASSAATMHYVGQVKNTYLLFQEADGLVLIDQHAAHERIRYEEIKKSFFKAGLTSQPLLISSTVKCKPEDIALAEEQQSVFEKLGFEFEPFGETSLILRALPEGLDQRQAAELFMAILEELRDADGEALLAEDPTSFSPKLDRMLATSACHSSIRAGQALSPKEAQELVVAMEKTASSLNCPHGRPASIKLSFAQIEGLFKR